MVPMRVVVMNNTCQFVLYSLQPIQPLFGSSIQQWVAMVESRLYDAACNCVGYIASKRTTNMPECPNMKLYEWTNPLTWSTKFNALSKVILGVFNFSQTSIQPPATMTDDRRFRCWRLWHLLKKQASDLLGFRSWLLDKNDSCKLTANIWMWLRQLLSRTVRAVYILLVVTDLVAFY